MKFILFTFYICVFSQFMSAQIIEDCISEPASINTSTIVSNEFIVLSRPTSASISLNQYDYINFDIKKLLNKANLNGPGGTGIAL